MRKFALSLGVLAVIGFAIPMTLPAAAETIVIKKGGDRGHHYGWDHNRGHRFGLSVHGPRDHRYDRKTVIIRRGDRDRRF